MSKPKIMYRISRGRNPKTGADLQRPVITRRETYTTDMAVQRGLDSGYMRGQFHDVRAVMDGTIATWQQLLKEGKAVHIGNWLRLQFNATGTVGDDRQLTDANGLALSITPLQDLQVKASDYEWVCVDDTANEPTIEYGSSPNGKRGEMIKTKSIVFTGRNLKYDSATDSVKIAWTEDGEAKTATLVPTEVSDTYLRFDWPTSLAEVEAGVEIAWSFRFWLPVGVDEKREVYRSETLKLVAAS